MAVILLQVALNLMGQESDLWVIKASFNGLIEWNKTFGTTNNEYGGSLLETNNGSLFCRKWRFK